MPIYEFACTEYGHQFERLMSCKDKPPLCPQCGGEVRKLFSAFACATGEKRTSLGEIQSSRSTSSVCASCRTRNCASCT